MNTLETKKAVLKAVLEDVSDLGEEYERLNPFPETIEESSEKYGYNRAIEDIKKAIITKFGE